MKTTKLDFPVMSSWMENNGRRLDCNPYLSGAFEAKVILEKLTAKKEPLHEVTKGGMKGIYHAGRERRQYVDDPAYGVPFLGSTDILAADLSFLSLLSKRQVAANPNFAIQEGYTLITRSGTIGRMVYVRSDMAGMACTEHAMRVVPDVEKILPGYLYAYLSSKFGVTLVISGTYGSIIQGIEPQHLADLPVPRLGENIEQEVDRLIKESSYLRTKASQLLREAREEFSWLGKGILDTPIAKSRPKINTVSSNKIFSRFEATYHNPIATAIEARVMEGQHTFIGGICKKVFLPGIFKRIHIEDENYGAPYYSGASMYWLEPLPKGILSYRTSLFEDVQIKQGTILVQAFGQADGLIGRPTWVGKHLDGATTTHMMVRLITHDPEMAGYLYAYIDSTCGYVQIARLPYGGSIPHFDGKGISSIPVPLLPRDKMLAISRNVLMAFSSRDEALDLEIKARNLVEDAIKEGC